MKILHVIPSLSPRRGGPSFTLRAMARALAEAGLEIHIVTTDDDGPDARLRVRTGQPLVEKGVTVWYFPRQTRFYTGSWPLTQWLAWHVGEYDLVHIHALFSYASMPAAFYAARYRVPYLVRPLGTLNRYGMQQRRPWLKQLSFHLLDRHVLARAAAVHYTSAQEQIEAQALGVPHRGVVIPLPVDVAVNELVVARGKLIARYPQLQGRTVALFLSRLDQKKGLDLLLPALAEARRTNPQLMLVVAGAGEPAFEAELQRLAADLNLNEAIIWAGFVAGEMKYAALADADFFILPSYSENFGIAAVEAMAAGLPVILSDQVGIHPEVYATRAGLVIPCAVAPLSSALHQLANNDELRQQMGQAAVRLVEQRYCPQAVAQQVIALYAELLATQSSPSMARNKDRNP